MLGAVRHRAAAGRTDMLHGTGLPEVVDGELAIRAGHRLAVTQDGELTATGRSDCFWFADPHCLALVAHDSLSADGARGARHAFVGHLPAGFVAHGVRPTSSATGGLTGWHECDEANAAGKDEDACFQFHDVVFLFDGWFGSVFFAGFGCETSSAWHSASIRHE